jgi:hypothetical protein
MLSFTTDQRRDLERLGVIEPQIVALESVLPGCQFAVTRQPTGQDVRDELNKATAAIQQATKVLSRLASHLTPASREALDRIHQASTQLGRGFGLNEFPEALSALETLANVVHKATDDLGPQQRRLNSADPTPIGLIHDALVLGWGKHASASEGSNPFPVAMLPALSHENKAQRNVFSQIVSICYAAATGSPERHERAIRAYLELRRAEKVRLSQHPRQVRVARPEADKVADGS